MNEIRFVATVNKVQTLADGGIRVSFDLSEADTLQMAQLAECKRFGAVLDVVVKAAAKDDEPEEGSKYGL